MVVTLGSFTIRVDAGGVATLVVFTIGLILEEKNKRMKDNGRGRRRGREGKKEEK